MFKKTIFLGFTEMNCRKKMIELSDFELCNQKI